MKEGENLEDQCIEGGLMLKRMLKYTVGGCEADMFGPGQGQMAGSDELGNAT